MGTMLEKVSKPKIVGRILDHFYSGKSPSTCRQYRSSVEAFCGFVGENSEHSFVSSLLLAGHREMRELVHGFRGHSKALGLSASTINARLAAIRGLVRAANELGAVEWSLEIGAERREPKRPVCDIETGDVLAMRQAILARPESNLRSRDLAVLDIFSGLALRRSEVAGLRLADVDVSRRRVMVTSALNGEKVAMSMTHELSKSLESWISVRGDWPGPLFTSFASGVKSKAPFTSSGLYKLVKAMGKSVGIVANPSSVRRASMMEALRKTGGDYLGAKAFGRLKGLGSLGSLSTDSDRAESISEVARVVSASFHGLSVDSKMVNFIRNCDNLALLSFLVKAEIKYRACRKPVGMR